MANPDDIKLIIVAAQRLVLQAEMLGIVLRIHSKQDPTLPLAMGNHIAHIDVWERKK